MTTQNRESGFTLVELAIVLVIIGLIVGGVLVGQDLIKAAEIRATISDIEKYNAAANTFRNKYAGLPGDLLAGKATQFGLTTRTGNTGMGDGNSQIEGCAVGDNSLGCENAVFWVDLTDAQLISQSFNTQPDGNTSPGALATVEALSDYLPSLRMRDSAFVHILPQAGRNYYLLSSLTTAGATGALTLNVPPAAPGALTPSEALQIDEKMDDGNPTSGTARAVDPAALTPTAVAVDPGAATAALQDECVFEGAAPAIAGDELYNVGTDDFASALTCHIFIRASF